MTTQILVTYATRTGSTQGIAEAIASTLTTNGATTELLPVQDITDLSAYDAVVAGSAIQSSVWLPEAMTFLHTHQAQLAQKPFAAFLVCMTLAMPYESARQQVPTFMQPVRDVVQPISEGYFAGMLDIDKIPQRQARWGFRVSTWFGAWKQGDHRDWETVRAWAQEIHPLLTAKTEDK